MKAKGIFFDLFGTLFICRDSNKAWENWVDVIFRNINSCRIAMDLENLKVLLDEFFSAEVPSEKDNLTGFTRYERRISNFFSKHSLDIPADVIRKTADETCARWSEEFIFDSDVIPVLKHFKKTKITALVSNYDHPRFVRQLFARNDLDRWFDLITISGEIDLHKPDPRIFHYTLEKLGLSPKEVVHIGDTSDDTEGAIAAGITPVLIDRNYAASGHQADYSKNSDGSKVHIDAEIRITKLSELIGIIE